MAREGEEQCRAVEMFDNDKETWFEARGWGKSAKVYGVVAKLASSRVLFSAEVFDLRGGPAVYLRKVRKEIANQHNIPRVSVKLLEPNEIEGTQVVVPVVLQCAWRYMWLETRRAMKRKQLSIVCEVCFSSCSDADDSMASTTREQRCYFCGPCWICKKCGIYDKQHRRRVCFLCAQTDEPDVLKLIEQNEWAKARFDCVKATNSEHDMSEEIDELDNENRMRAVVCTQ